MQYILFDGKADIFLNKGRMERGSRYYLNLGKTKKLTWNVVLKTKQNGLLIRNMINKCRYIYVNLLYYKQHSLLHVLGPCCGCLQGGVI